MCWIFERVLEDKTILAVLQLSDLMPRRHVTSNSHYSFGAQNIYVK